MEWSELKPLARALALPPGSLVLLGLCGLLLARSGRALWRRAGWATCFAALALLWLLSCSGFAVILSRALLSHDPPATVEALRRERVQAIVVLGGGVERDSPEYGQSQPGAATLARLRYGAHLARASGLPLGFAGGVGWVAIGTGVASEGEVARRVWTQEMGVQPRWVDDTSRDTRENAANMRALLARDGITRIALVTHDWHMQRSVRNFRELGLQVLPAPTGYLQAGERTVLQWLPSTHGMEMSVTVLREWVGLRVT